MAIYHAHIQVIGRSTGRSVVAAAAYRAAYELQDERQNRTHDYTAKQGVVHSEIMLRTVRRALGARTTKASLHARARPCGTRWRRRSAARTRSLRARWSSPCRGSCRARRRSAGAGFRARAVRGPGDGGGPERALGRGEDGEDAAARARHADHAPVTPEGFGPKEREWNATGLYERWRERWAELANERLCGAGA